MADLTQIYPSSGFISASNDTYVFFESGSTAVTESLLRFKLNSFPTDLATVSTLSSSVEFALSTASFSDTYKLSSRIVVATSSLAAIINKNSYHHRDTSWSISDGIFGHAYSVDGTRFYIADNVSLASNEVYQIDLQVPFDLSTSVDGETGFSGSMTGVSSEIEDFKMSDDGTKAYLLEATNTINQYTLTDAWQIGTGTDSGFGHSPSAQMNSPSLFAFTDNGSTLVYYGTYSQGTGFFRYSVATAWDLSSTVTYQNLSFQSVANTVNGMHFSMDGKYMYLKTTSNTIQQYELSTAGNPATRTLIAEINSTRVDIDTDDTGLSIHPSGSYLTITRNTGKDILSYWLSTPFMIDSIQSKRLSPNNTNIGNIDISNDGYNVISSISSTALNHFILNKQWDISDLKSSQTYNPTAQLTSLDSVLYSGNGDYVYMLGLSASAYHILQYQTSSPYYARSLTYLNKSLNVDAYYKTDSGSFTISDDGSTLYVLSGSYVSIFPITHAWEIISASYSSTVDFSGLDTHYMSLDFSKDGRVFYLGGSQNSYTIFQWDLSTAWDLSTKTLSPNQLTASFFRIPGFAAGDGNYTNIDGLVVNGVGDLFIRSTGGVESSIEWFQFDSGSNIILAASASDGAFEVIDSNVTNTTDGVSGSIQYTYVNTTASASLWNNAFVELKQEYIIGAGISGSLLTTGDGNTAVDDASYLSFNTDTTEVQTVGISSIPLSFISMIGGLTFDVTYNILGWKDDDFDLSMRITNGATILAAADSGGTYQTVANNIQNSADVATGAISFTYVNTTATRDDWVNADIQLQQTYAKSKGGDNANIRINYIELAGFYLSYDDLGIKLDTVYLDGTYISSATGLGIKWNNVVWSNIANLDGVTAANIASVDGVS